MSSPIVRFAAIGLNHGHIYSMVNVMLEAGAQLASFHAPEPDLAARFSSAFPQARLARSSEEILEDGTVQLILGAGIPCERASLGIAAMRHGKDFMSDKPAFTSLDQLARVRRVQSETGRIYSVCYSERLLHRATVRASQLVAKGAVGRVVQTIGLGPHRIGLYTRPPWFFRRSQYGGIICDIGAHQTDQFLHFTGSSSADVVSAHVANYRYPEYPELEDFGEALLRGDGGTGYVRVDWYTPDGLGTWGDGRLIVLGTDGYIEVRKNCDIAGRTGADHLFLVDRESTRYIDCSDVQVSYGRHLVRDIVERTETAMSQAHCFLASELALRAQASATRLHAPLPGPASATLAPDANPIRDAQDH